MEVFQVRAAAAAAAAATFELSTVAVAVAVVVVVVVPHAVREENKIQHIKNTSQYRVAVGPLCTIHISAISRFYRSGAGWAGGWSVG